MDNLTQPNSDSVIDSTPNVAPPVPLEPPVASPTQVPIQTTVPLSSLPPSSTLTPNLTPIKSSYKWLMMFLFIILGLVIVSGAVYGGMVFERGRLSTSTPSPTITPEPNPTPSEAVASPTPDLLADWKTYFNTSLGIKFSYPSLWTIRGFGGDNENGSKSDETMTRFVIENPDNSFSLSVMNSIFEGAYDMCMSEQKPSETQIIDGVAFSKSIFVSHCPETDSKFITFFSTDKQLTLTFNYTKTNQLESEKIISEILSTFEYTD